jgi:hypothetical protein
MTVIRHALADGIVAALTTALTTAGRPLLIRWTADAPLPVERVFRLARAHPGLDVVVAADSDQPPVLLACRTPVLMATSGLDTTTLGALAATVGPERLVFGSGHPLRPAGEQLRRACELGLCVAASVGGRTAAGARC